MRWTRIGFAALLTAYAVGATACAPSIVPLSTLPAPVERASESDNTPEEMRSHASVVTTQMVRHTVDSLLTQPMFRTATWGALVLNGRGDTIYARNAATLLVPASNMKIVTAATALVQLGPDYRFRPNALALTVRDTFPSDFGPTYDTMLLRDRPLRDVLPKMLKPSQNRLAEQLSRTVALERTGVSSRDSAIAVTQRQLSAWDIPNDGYIVSDGSGYDRGNYLSAETLTRILAHMRGDTVFSVFYEALPVAGVDGTLAKRLRATRAEHNAHAKTGSLRSIRSLSGYVTTASGEDLTFSFVCNAYTTSGERVTRVMDRAVALLAELAETP